MKIVLCGSMAFSAEMETIGRKLSANSHEVIVPTLLIDGGKSNSQKKISIRSFIEDNGGAEAFPSDHYIWQEKANAIDDHFAKIANADAILVVNYPKHNIDGYIGGNTLMEMALARYLKKKVYILYPVSPSLTYYEEIFGMQPTILNNNLSVIG